MDDKPVTSGDMIAALGGAAVAKGIVIAGKFTTAAIWGFDRPTFSPVGARKLLKYGLESGFDALGLYAGVLLITFGIPQWAVGLIGAVITLPIRWGASQFDAACLNSTRAGHNVHGTSRREGGRAVGTSQGKLPYTAPA